ncbi:MAG: GTPase HflX [Nitrospirota bacterium]
MISERALLVAKTATQERRRQRPSPAIGPGVASPARSKAAASSADDAAALDELEELARSAGAIVVGRLVQRSAAADPRFLIGAGKAMELREWCRHDAIDIVIFNADLTPAQTRHLEALLDVKVIDRTQLILDIFAQRARSREGQLQVELAQLRYLLPRLVGKGVALSRLGGGIGTRGPGEMKLEVDRRRIRQRISALERHLARIASARAMHRDHRRREAVPLVALVGYTNAGKSTLFNALTGSGVKVEDRLFATLDPTIRHVQLPRKTMIALSDTVGFVRQLPHSLIAAFTATLEEVRSAQCLLHVVDYSHLEWREQADAVERVLAELGASAIPRITVLNKIDRLNGAVEPTAAMVPAAGEGPVRAVVAISALTGRGVDRLTDQIESLVSSGIAAYALSIPAERGDLIAQVHDKGRVLRRVQRGDRVSLTVELTDEAIRQWGEAWAPFFTPARPIERRAAAACS